MESAEERVCVSYAPTVPITDVLLIRLPVENPIKQKFAFHAV